MISSPSGDGVFHAERLVKTYARGTPREVAAVSDCSFSVAGRELVVLRGRSGSGKSTLLNICSLLTRADSGSLRLDGREASTLGAAEAADLRSASIGVVFQAFNLIPHLTARQNVALAIPGGRRAAEERADELLDRFEIGGRGAHRPGELSGGEQQRVAIARALANRPVVLVADEPTGNLDAASEAMVLKALRTAADDGCAVLIASHSDVVASSADRTLTMLGGHIVADGTREGSE